MCTDRMIEAFLDSKNANTRKSFESTLKRMGEDNFLKAATAATKEGIEYAIESMHPDIFYHIKNACLLFSSYGTWLFESGFQNGAALKEVVGTIDKDELWKKLQKNACKKFISYDDFLAIKSQIKNDLDSDPDAVNINYLPVLFESIYYGVYSSDLSVILNLRKGDIDCKTGLVKMLCSDGERREITVPVDVANRMSELSCEPLQGKNRFGIFEYPIKSIGLYQDSVFKFKMTKRNNASSPYYMYYNKIKLISDYAGFDVTANTIYISGVCNRIKALLSKFNYSLEDALNVMHNNQMVRDIMQSELDKSNYDIPACNFKKIISGHESQF